MNFQNKVIRLNYLLSNNLPIHPNDYLPNAQCFQCSHNIAQDLIFLEINRYLCMRCNIQNYKNGDSYFTEEEN